VKTKCVLCGDTIDVLEWSLRQQQLLMRKFLPRYINLCTTVIIIKLFLIL